VDDELYELYEVDGRAELALVLDGVLICALAVFLGVALLLACARDVFFFLLKLFFLWGRFGFLVGVGVVVAAAADVDVDFVRRIVAGRATSPGGSINHGGRWNRTISFSALAMLLQPISVFSALAMMLQLISSICSSSDELRMSITSTEDESMANGGFCMLGGLVLGKQ
jgi:hypothetical protein